MDNKTFLAINTTLVGLFVVFFALVLLAIIIYFFGKVFSIRKDQVQETSAAKEPEPVVPVIEDAEETLDNDNSSDGQLIAVLTAAVQAVLNQGPECRIRVKSFRRVANTAAPWNAAGRTEYLAKKL